MLGSLYDESGSGDIAFNLNDLLTATDPSASAASKLAATQRFVARLKAAEERRDNSFRRSNFNFPYNNSLDAFLSVTCTDSVNAKNLSKFGAIGAKADARAKYFGRSWLWSTAACSSSRWTAKDEDSWRGPFNRRTRAPVLVVGNYWDPATRYEGAETAARLLPNSRLLTSDSWGHTAYGTSDCVTSAVERYLVSVTLPAAGTTCVGDIQPFQDTDAARTAQKPITIQDLVAPPVLPGLRSRR